MQMVPYDEELKTAFQVFSLSKSSTRGVVIISIFIRQFQFEFPCLCPDRINLVLGVYYAWNPLYITAGYICK